MLAPTEVSLLPDKKRIEARAAGSTRYASTCIHGHFERYTSSGACCECANRRKRTPSRRAVHNAARRTPEYRAKERARAASRDKPKHAAREKAWRKARPHAILVREAKARAKEKGLPFSLETRRLVVPTHCPVLGIPLKVGDGKLHDASPTLDRLVPQLGYVLTNVTVMSHRANRMKNNGTPEELRKVADWMERALKARELL